MNTVPEVTEESGHNPVHNARVWAEELQKICRVSLQYRLPVLFYG
jgi:hypothetical protein